MDTSTGTTSEENTRTVQRGPAPDRGQMREDRPREVNSFRHGSVIGNDSERSRVPVETLRTDGAALRSFTDHQRKMLADLDATGNFDTPPVTEQSADGGLNGVATGSDPKPPTTAATTTTTEPPKVDPAPDHVAQLNEVTQRADRLAEVNRKLVAKLEQSERRRSTQAPDSRMSALDEIERSWTTDPHSAMRRLTALNAGIDDPSSPDVDRILSDIYTEWTAKELKMRPDPAVEALLESRRNRMLFERDRRAREAAEKASTETKTQETQAARDAQVSNGITARLEASKHAERFPLLMQYSSLVDRMTPGELVWRAIQQDIQAGVLDPKADDESLINHASKKIETFYQDYRAKLSAASQSTAPTTQATVPVADKQADASPSGVRTITNASASVAPAAPPTATTPSAQAKPQKMSEESRRRALAAKHFPGD